MNASNMNRMKKTMILHFRQLVLICGCSYSICNIFFSKKEQFKINMINEFRNHSKNIFKNFVELNKFLALLIVKKKSCPKIYVTLKFQTYRERVAHARSTLKKKSQMMLHDPCHQLIFNKRTKQKREIKKSVLQQPSSFRNMYKN